MRHQVPFSPRRYTLYQELSQSKKDAAPELEAVFANGDMIVVGREPGCRMHRLPHWQEVEGLPQLQS